MVAVLNAGEPASEVDLVAECQGRLAVAQAENENLKIALVSSRRIGAAIGIIMAVHHLTDDEAFLLLRRASNDHNMKLRDISEHVLWTGDLPPR